MVNIRDEGSSVIVGDAQTLKLDGNCRLSMVLAVSSSKRLNFSLTCKGEGNSNQKAGLLVARFLKDGKELQAIGNGWNTSDRFGNFIYLESSSDGVVINRSMPIAGSADTMVLELRRWDHRGTLELPNGIRLNATRISQIDRAEMVGSKRPQRNSVLRRIQRRLHAKWSPNSVQTPTYAPPGSAESRTIYEHDKPKTPATFPRQPSNSTHAQSTLFSKELPLQSIGDVLLKFTMRADRRDEKGAVVSVEYKDHTGNPIPGPHFGLSKGNIGWFRYHETDIKWLDYMMLLAPPENVSTACVRILGWNKCPGVALRDDPVLEPACYDRDAMLAALPTMSNSVLRASAELTQRHGDPDMRGKLLRTLYENTRDPRLASASRHNKGLLRELDTTWLPSIGGTTGPIRDDGNPLSVCHIMKVSRRYEDTGGSIRNYYTVKTQKEAGIDPFVVTPLGYPGQDDIPQEPKVTLANVDHYQLDLPRKAAKQIPPDTALELEVRFIAGIIRNRGCSVIHAASGYRGYENALKGLALKQHFNLPLVYEVRSFHEHTWRSPVDWVLDAPLTRARMAQERRCIEAADHVVTIAHAMKEQLVKQGCPEDKITVIPNAVDNWWFEDFDEKQVHDIREQHGLNDNKVLGYISNLSKREGHYVLLEAAALLKEWGNAFKVLIVGEGPERESLQKQAADLGIGGDVVFTGNVPHKDIRAYYKAIDIFVVPRTADYASDFVTPMKPFEALSLARPIIMSDRPVTREIIGDNERGLSFETSSAGSLAQKIILLDGDSDMSQALASAGRKWVRQERSWAGNAIKYKALYEMLASN